LVSSPEDYFWSSYRVYTNPNVSPGWLETSFVLDMFSHDYRTAVDEFKRYSVEADDRDYMDWDNDIKIRTREEGITYLKEYLNQIACGTDINQVKKNKILRNEVILNLRAHTDLSQRLIAEILGINKSTIEKIKS
jgi:DNA-directed RNA polymerase specialized sigma24 family protein